MYTGPRGDCPHIWRRLQGSGTGPLYGCTVDICGIAVVTVARRTRRERQFPHAHGQSGGLAVHLRPLVGRGK